MKKFNLFKFIKTAINIFIIVMLAAFVIVVCLQRFSDNKISIFSYRMFTVISGSMKPKYIIGDVLISKEIKPSEVEVGDTVSYLGTKGDFYGKVITHEVVGIEVDANGKYSFHTKGLANLVEDPVITEDQLYGKVIYKSVILSTIYRIVATSIGFYIFIILPLLYVIGSEILAVMLNKEEERRKKLKND